MLRLLTSSALLCAANALPATSAARGRVLRPSSVANSTPKPRSAVATTGAWRSADDLPPIDVPPDGWFDADALGSCVVRKFSNEMDGDRWMMWYTGRGAGLPAPSLPLASGAVGLAHSTDGLSWQVVAGDEQAGSVLGPNEDEWWTFDTLHVGVGDVHVMSNDVVRNSMGLYWMYYYGGDATELELDGVAAPEGSNMAIGVALSNDGVHWGRVEGGYSSGAILEPDDDEVFVGWPQVVQASADMWHMYYHALQKSTGRFAIGVATSSNCVEWTRRDGYILEASADETAFDAGGVSARCVVREHGEWLMFFEGIDHSGTHSIGLARSADGLSWTRSAEPVFSPSTEPGSWDGASVARPWVVPCDDGSARLYFVGRSDDGTQGIGAADSAGSDWSTFTRCAGAGA